MAAAVITSMLHRNHSNAWALLWAVSAALLVASPRPAHAANVNFAWDRSTDANVVGYNLSYGTTSRSYSQTVNAGNSNSATVSLTPGATYYFVVTAYNSFGLQSSPSNEVALTMPNNIPPSVSLTSPQSNARFKSGSTIGVSAQASDSDGSITKVEFYQNSFKIAETTTPPYAAAWRNVSAGNYILTALAYDDAGLAVRSAGVPVKVTGNPNTASETATPTPRKVRVVALTPLIRAGDAAKFKMVASEVSWTEPTVVNYSMSGTATSGVDYATPNTTGQVTIPAGARATLLSVQTLKGQPAGGKTAVIGVLPGDGYAPGRANAVVRILNQ